MLVFIHQCALSIRPTLCARHCVHKSILYTCFSVPPLQIDSWIQLSSIPYICVNRGYLFFSFCLNSVRLMYSRFIHLTSTDSHSFFFMTNTRLYICTHDFFIHSPVDGHPGCFHVLAIANSVAMKIGVHVSFGSRFSPDMCPGVGLQGENNLQIMWPTRD